MHGNGGNMFFDKISAQRSLFGGKPGREVEDIHLRFKDLRFKDLKFKDSKFKVQSSRFKV
jgi:hypothetical protein